MIFNLLSFNNFGLFQGLQEIPLAPSKSGRPIVLIGGKNGSGKTTTLEAVRLCLYGPNAIDRRSQDKGYWSYIASRFNRAALLRGETKAALKLEFTCTHGGRTSAYVVSREWERDEEQFHEQLSILCDGEPLKAIEKECWQDFLKELVPPGVSRFFFFDGEDIQRLASDYNHNEALASSIKALLNLDLIERLGQDLTVFTRRIGRLQSDPISTEIQQTQEERDKTASTLANLAQEKSSVLAELGLLEKRKENLEEQLRQEGGFWVEERPKLLEKREHLEKERREIVDQLHNFCGDLLPFAMLPGLCSQLREQILFERRRREWMAAHTVFKRRENELFRALTGRNLSPDAPPLLPKQKAALKKRLRAFWKQVFEKVSSEGQRPLIHNLSEKEEEKIIGLIQKAQSVVPQIVRELLDRRESLTRQIREVDHRLAKVPKEEIVSPLLSEMTSLNQQIGMKREELRQLEERLSECSRAQAELEKRLVRLEDSLKEKVKAEEHFVLSEKIQKVLAAFLAKLSKEKVAKLEGYLTEMYNRLARKEELIRFIRISPETYQVTLINRDGNEIPKAELSAGEKQIYAIAMLWALGQTSRKPLPIIIDTPLGRLDSDHRRAIVHNYFPHASHQVIILSTDTEVDRDCYAELRPYLSHAICFDYNVGEDRTVTNQGYFWRESSVEQLAL